jgi:eukaryotic-like serine/threonine-protein kinase
VVDSLVFYWKGSLTPTVTETISPRPPARRTGRKRGRMRLVPGRGPILSFRWFPLTLIREKQRKAGPALPTGRTPPFAAPMTSDTHGGAGDGAIRDGRPGAGTEWARVKRVFLDALEQPEPERSAFLERVCGPDTALRAEVASLLASERAAGNFCEAPAAQLIDLDELDEPVPAAPRLPTGTVLGAYEITGFLSAGGMGQVYRARHSLLGRDAAIKTVSAGDSDPASRRRLLREARHAAELDHPNICPIYEVGVADELPYIVMALLPGRPLSELLRPELPPLGQALSIGTQVAAALEHAHGRGIVHRDLKSSNVVVDERGRAVVLDFGISRRLPREGTASSADLTATVTGMLAGTLSHMAPEVLFGGDADPRSDIWSLGVLLYELTTGTLPFHGRSPFETSSAILHQLPAPLPGSVPLALRLVIERCLAKDPARRYQTAGAVRTALEAIIQEDTWRLTARLLFTAHRRRLGITSAAAAVLLALSAAAPRVYHHVAATRAPALATLAVLPLAFEEADSTSAWHAAGLTYALIDQLGEAADVRLIARTSAARAAAGSAGPAEAARSLGADAVVTGRMRRDGDRVAVAVRLVAADGRVLWSDSFERSVAQVLVLQSDIVRSVAAGVRLALRPGSGARLAAVRAVNPEAYEAYVKGRFEWNQRTPASLERAAGHFRRAIDLDPTYAPAHAALADCYNQLGTVLVGAGSPREFRPLATAAAIRALQIDPHSAEAHATLAYARHYDWQWSEAERGFRRALELNPSYALARIWYANFLMSRGRMTEALDEVYRAQAIDPFSLVVNTNVGWVLIGAGRYEDAIIQLQQVLALDSTYVQARLRLVDALMDAGRHAEAREQVGRLVSITGDWPPALISLAHVHARTAAPDSARSILAALLERRAREHVSTAGIASIYSRLGDTDQAIDWYTRTLEERSNAAVYLAFSTSGSPLQRDPRFRALLVSAGLN